MLVAVVFIIIIERLLVKLGGHHSPNHFGQLSLFWESSLKQVIRQVMVIKMRTNACKRLEY